MNPNSILLLLLILLPSILIGQIDCKNEQIDLLRLDLIPSFQNSAIIEIKCDSSSMSLNFKILEYRGKEKSSETYTIPIETYESFKSVVLPLHIQSMFSVPNPYMSDGMLAEITFMDRYGNFNRFSMRFPMPNSSSLFLVKTILSLVEKLQINREQRDYIKIIRKMYLPD
ncbi:MAG: hypothetical protein AAFO07_02070 [Bacteroidota bacterium]